MGADWQDNTKRHSELLGCLRACLLFGSTSMTQRDIPRWIPSPAFPFLPYPSLHPLTVTPSFFLVYHQTMFILQCTFKDVEGFWSLWLKWAVKRRTASNLEKEDWGELVSHTAVVRECVRVFMCVTWRGSQSCAFRLPEGEQHGVVFVLETKRRMCEHVLQAQVALGKGWTLKSVVKDDHCVLLRILI